jgi:hypothetical protein
MRKDRESEEPKPIATPGLSFKDLIFEQLSDGSFLIYERATGQTRASNLLIHDGLEYLPLSQTPWPSACLPVIPESEDPPTKEQLIEKLKARRFQGEYGDPEQLFNEIKDFFMEHLDVSNPLFYDVYAAWVLVTWRLEDFKVVPYLFYLGPLSSGKTRGLECLNRLAYRAIMASSVSAAVIFRVLQSWHPTLLLDETEIYNRECMVEVLALLNSGYRRGQWALRMEKVEDGNPTIGFFDCYGPKAMAGTEELAATLQSRAFITRMSKNVKHIRLFVDEEKAQELRNKLLLYRFRNLGMGLDYDVSVLNGSFTNARVIELFVAMLQIAPTEEIRNRLIDCMKQITQSRLDEEQASIEARVFDAVMKCEDRLEKGKVSTSTITELFNLGLPEKEQSTSRFIGRKVAGLGFEKCRLTGGVSGFYWNKELIDRLKARYEPASKTTSLTSLTSQTSLDTEKSASLAQVPSEVSEDKSSLSDSGSQEKTVKSEVSEESEVSEVSLEAAKARGAS